MSTLEERMEAATRAMSSGGGAAAQKTDDLESRIDLATRAISSGSAQGSKPKGNYYLNAAKEGLAMGIGNVADFIPRAIALPVAAGGVLASEMGLVDAKSLPDLRGLANPNTDRLKSLFGVEEIQPPSKSAAIVGSGIRGATSLPLPMGAGNVVAQTIMSSLIGGAGGMGAEAGGQVADRYAPGNPYARVGAELAGGFLGGVAVPSSGGVMGVVKRAREGLSDVASNQELQSATRNTAEKIIDRQVKGAVSGTPDAAQNITDALRLRERISGFNPSVAEMANSPGLSEMQRRYSLLTPQRLNEEVARDAGNVAAIKKFYESTAGKQTPQGAIRSSVNQDLSDSANELSGRARGIAARVPVEDQMAIGNRASEIARAEKVAARPEITAAYEKAFNAAGDAKIDVKNVVDKVEDILGQKITQIKPEAAPQTVRQLQKMFGDETEVTGLTLRDVDSLRKAINIDSTAAARSSDPIAATKLRNFTMLHDEIDASVKNANLPNGSKELYSEAVRKYREEFAPRFKEGSNAKMFRDTSLNEPRVVADKFVAEYFKPDTQGGMTQSSYFKRLFGENAEAKDLTKKGILDTYRQKVVNAETGEIDVGAHNRFMRDHQRTLISFKMAGVNANDELSEIGKQATKVADLQKKAQILSKQMKFDTTDDLVSEALRSEKVMGNLLSRVGPENRENLQRTLMDRAWDGGTGASMQKFLTDHQKTLRMALSPKHMQDMSDISKALEISERATIRGTLASGGADVLKNTTGVSMATVWAQYRATSGGRQGLMTGVFNLAAPVMTKLSQTSFNDIMQKALHDPATAKSLRDFLISNSESASNDAAVKLLKSMGNTAKMAGSIVWDSKADIGKMVLGLDNYGKNIGRSSQAVSNEVQELEQSPP